MRHCFEFPDLFLSYHFSLLANHALNEMYTDDSLVGADSQLKRRRLLSTVFLCLKGLYEQAQHGYVCSMIYKVIRDKLWQRDRDLLMSELGLKDWPEEDGGDMAKRCRSVWPMPATKRGEDPKKYPLQQLIKGYSKMAINDILNQDDDYASGAEQELSG